MKPNLLLRIFTCCLLASLAVGLLAACAVPTAVVQPPASAGETEPAGTAGETPAPTVRPTEPPVIDPAAEETAEPAADGCPLSAEPLYVNEEHGYCFSYPDGFTPNELTSDLPTLGGPALDESAQPLRASLNIFTYPVREGTELSGLVAGYLGQNSLAGAKVERSAAELGGEPAEVLSGVPGQLPSRVVMALHEGMLFQLAFHPEDVAAAEADLNELYEAVMGSFSFFTPAQLLPVGPARAAFVEFGRYFRFQYDPTLSLLVEGESVEAVPPSPDIMFSDAHPAMAQFRFLGYDGGRAAQLPYPFQTPRLMVFRTADFAGYGDDVPTGFPAQLAQLRELLDNRPDLAQRCDPHGAGEESRLPFLPWLNSGQVMCAKADYIEFEGSAGIRYLTAYAQGVGPVLDPDLFYTFQGLSDDGQLYFSAVFPALSGALPLEVMLSADGQPPMVDRAAVTAALNGQADELFQPALGKLDALVSSLEFVKE